MPLQTEPHQAKAVGKNLRVSWKHCTEIGRFIKGDSVEKAKNKLEKVMDKDLAVPATKFDTDAGHQGSGQGKGRYPVKAAEEVLQVLESAEGNAENEGLNPAALEVQEFITNQGPSFRTPKRHRGRELKSGHIKIIVGER
jgi:large subunit ribosomal protein L22